MTQVIIDKKNTQQATTEDKGIDKLYQIAEKLAEDFSLFPNIDDDSIYKHVQGLVSHKDCQRERKVLRNLDIDNYIERVVSPSENNARMSAKTIVNTLAHKIITELDEGALYVAEVELDFGSFFRRIGFICQNREHNNGAWLPRHHDLAAQQVRNFAKHSIPVVTLIDTPGADAGEEANANNQAHTISHLITEMANLDVPSLSIIWGAGYSGGAIPLATANLLLSVRDGIFNTIQPQGLASIARKYNLSWQECAKFVGVSAYELQHVGVIDGIIDFAPSDGIEKQSNLLQAIVSGIQSIEDGATEFARNNPYLMEHYQRSVTRFLSPSEKLDEMQRQSSFFLANNPTEHSNIFGITFRYLRYLTLRRRIHSKTLESYGRLAEKEIPTGELSQRLEKAAQRKFQNWMQAPEKIVYDETLHKSWKNFWTKFEDRDEERNSIFKMFLGEPKDNYLKAKQQLCFNLGLYLFNRWKADATKNFQGLMTYMEDYKQNRFLLRADDILDASSIAEFIFKNEHPLAGLVLAKVSHESQQKITAAMKKEQSKGQLNQLIAAALNKVLRDEPIADDICAQLKLSDKTQALANSLANVTVEANRRIFEEALAPYIQFKQESIQNPAHPDITILDAILHDELRNDFIQVCQNMLVFGELYDHIIHNLPTVAKEANIDRALSQDSVRSLLLTSLAQATEGDSYTPQQRESFDHWLSYFSQSNQRGNFLKSVEEWKKLAFPQLSDTLFVIITFFFEKLLHEYQEAEQEGKAYSGRINPVSIGRRKDFWNRLTMAYHDLLIQRVLEDVKREKKTMAPALIKKFFTNFEEVNSNLLSADPVNFPGFRSSIEQALNNGITPCGVVTGFGNLCIDGEEKRVGALVSNLDFQAGAFDMASAEKFCKLLVECSRQQLPVVCFISSGGMQTKEGAAALFS
ncbi:MAG: carbamoyl-phosphate synthase large subunit, partial [Oleispira antarctica]|nr:carbamoyl-phosphate synthase large subunit [Oleispira antarctica]MBQ0792963.1 carbamoyl-phosphate synthase large subunit [Oleispira antarctica]